MATKKQKRQMMEQRREAFEAEVRDAGRKAQETDRQRREAQASVALERAHKKHYKFNKDCSLCSAIKAKQALAKIIPTLSKATVSNG